MRLTLACQHSWDLLPEQAVQLQKEMRKKVLQQPLDIAEVKTVAGLDVGFNKDIARAAAIVMKFPSLEPIVEATAETPVSFPYIPGLLSFREAPVLLAALDQLEQMPDVIICDGHGWAHPRRFGIACHLGVLLDRPVIGCAKSLLVGKYSQPGNEVGSVSELQEGGEVIGMALRTRAGAKPVFVSVGHRVDLPSATRLVAACSHGYRLPEPTRLADRLASRRR